MQNVINALKADQLRKLSPGEPVHILDGRKVYQAYVVQHGNAAFAYVSITSGGVTWSHDREWIYGADEKARLVADLRKMIVGAEHLIGELKSELLASPVDAIREHAEVA